jgi:hypothetical protein
LSFCQPGAQTSPLVWAGQSKPGFLSRLGLADCARAGAAALSRTNHALSKTALPTRYVHGWPCRALNITRVLYVYADGAGCVGACTARGKTSSGRLHCRRPPSIGLPSLAASLVKDARIGERTRVRGSAPLEGAVRNVHCVDAEDAEMLRLVSPRAVPRRLDVSKPSRPEIEHSRVRLPT